MKFKINKQRSAKISSFKDILPDLLKEMQIGDFFSIEVLKKNWEEIVGNIIAAHSMPDRIFKRTLFIAVDHPIFANDIVMMKELIIKKLNNLYPSHPIVNIKSEVKKIIWE